MPHGSSGSRNPGSTASWVTVTVAVIGAIATIITAWIQHTTDREKLEKVQAQVQTQPGSAVPAAGRYEWQWAGEGWKGYITVGENGDAHIEMYRYLNCDGTQKVMPLLQQAGNGRIESRENSSKLAVTIPVQFVKYDKLCANVGLEVPTTLKGELDRKIAFAGSIEYENPYGAPLGDMILIKDYTSGVHQ